MGERSSAKVQLSWIEFVQPHVVRAGAYHDLRAIDGGRHGYGTDGQ